MPKQSMSVAEARACAQKLADEMGYELVDVELVKGEGVTLDELEAFHRRIQPLIDRVDFDYMEVSSPGADRPLKTERDFVRAEGMPVELHTYRPVNGAKLFRGDLVGLQEGEIVLNVAGEELRFPKKTVSMVKPYIDFDEDDLEDDVPQGN